jgi:hypothetical protein
VARHHVDLIDLNHTLELHLCDLGEQAFSQARRHGLGVVLIEVQFMGDLAVGEIEPHKLQAQNPNA